jgi:polo-like kinase 1
MQQHKRFPEAVVRVWLAQIVCGMEHMHRHRVVHRDLKLENLLLRKDGSVAIGDFGFSRQLPTIDARLTSFAGTLHSGTRSLS